MWQLTSAAHGQHRAALEHLRKTKGLAVPALEGEPKIFPPYEWLWRAFRILSEKRGRDDGHPLAIPVTEIKALVDFDSVAGEEQRSLLFYVVSALDSKYMAHYWEEHKKQRDAADRARQARQRR